MLQSSKLAVSALRHDVEGMIRLVLGIRSIISTRRHSGARFSLCFKASGPQVSQAMAQLIFELWGQIMPPVGPRKDRALQMPCQCLPIKLRGCCAVLLAAGAPKCGSCGILHCSDMEQSIAKLPEALGWAKPRKLHSSSTAIRKCTPAWLRPCASLTGRTAAIKSSTMTSRRGRPGTMLLDHKRFSSLSPCNGLASSPPEDPDSSKTRAACNAPSLHPTLVILIHPSQYIGLDGVPTAADRSNCSTKKPRTLGCWAVQHKTSQLCLCFQNTLASESLAGHATTMYKDAPRADVCRKLL